MDFLVFSPGSSFLCWAPKGFSAFFRFERFLFSFHSFFKHNVFSVSLLYIFGTCIEREERLSRGCGDANVPREKGEAVPAQR